MEINNVRDRFSNLADDLGSLLEGFGVHAEKQVALGLSGLNQAMEHFDSMAILINSGRCGSAAALVRPFMDAATRGCWLTLVATDEQARMFAENDRLPDRAALLRDLRKLSTIDAGAFEVDPVVWKYLHGLTHTGYNQLSHRLNGGALSGNYRPDFVEGMLRSVIPAGVWTTITMGRVLGVPMIEQEAVARLEEQRWWSITT